MRLQASQIAAEQEDVEHSRLLALMHTFTVQPSSSCMYLG